MSSASNLANRVFVSNLPPTATQDHVAKYFEQFGHTLDVYVPLVWGTCRHKGIAYVTFEQADAKDAALYCREHVVEGQPIAVQHCIPKDEPFKGCSKGGCKGKAVSGALVPWTEPNSENRIFVQGIGQEVTQAEVESYFSQFGSWLDLFMPRGSFTAGHKGLCFISFASRSSVDEVLCVAPHAIAGQPVNVDLAVARDAKGGGKGAVGVRCKGGGEQVRPHHAWAMRDEVPHQPGFGQQLSVDVLHDAQQQIQQTTQVLQQQLQQQQRLLMQVQAMQNVQGMPSTADASGQHHLQNRGGNCGKVIPGRIFLTKMSPMINKEDLEAYFSRFGELNDVYIPPGGKHIAFIGFDDPGVASSIAASPTHEVKYGCTVRVDAAVERPSLGSKGYGKNRANPY